MSGEKMTPHCPPELLAQLQSEVPKEETCPCCAGQVHDIPPPSDEGIGFIVHTSVYDGLSSARFRSDDDIRRAIDYESCHRKRSSLIQGLQRELRKRQKGLTDS